MQRKGIDVKAMYPFRYAATLNVACSGAPRLGGDEYQMKVLSNLEIDQLL